MVPQDWVVAILVTVSVTVAVYWIGRRLDSGSAPAPPKDAPKREADAAKAKPSAKEPAQSKAAAPAKGGTPKPSETEPKPKPAAKAEAASSADATPKAAPATPSATDATPKAAAATPQIARLEYEEDEDIDPTRVGPKQEPAAPQRVIYSPKIHPIAFDKDIPSEDTAAGVQLLVHARAQTDTGLRRKRNEDSLLVLEDEGVFVIADGMGGYRGGATASATAVTTIEKAYKQRLFEGPAHEGVPPEATDLARAIQMANSAILDTAKEQPELEGMGTTICAARFTRSVRRLFIGHVGDSRCYRMRDGTLKQMTADHTMADHGVTGPEAAQLSRAVGVWPTVPIDIVMGAPVPGDVYLLCSDGLTKMLKDPAIAEVVRTEPDPQLAVERLVQQANARGGKDNITVILIRVVPPGWKPPSKAPPKPEEGNSGAPDGGSATAKTTPPPTT